MLLWGEHCLQQMLEHAEDTFRKKLCKPRESEFNVSHELQGVVEKVNNSCAPCGVVCCVLERTQCNKLKLLFVMFLITIHSHALLF